MPTTLHHKPHIAIIMDGNGRWAEARGLPRPAGHPVGADTVRTIVRTAIEEGVGALTLYAFSTYNWRRPEAEVAGLMTLLRQFLLVEAPKLREAGVRISMLGRRDRLPLGLVKAIAAAERRTASGATLHLRIAIDYSAATPSSRPRQIGPTPKPSSPGSAPRTSISSSAPAETSASPISCSGNAPMRS